MANDPTCASCRASIGRGPRFVCHGCQHVIHWTTKSTGFAGNILTALNEVRMNVLLICNDCASNGTRDEIISRGSRNLVESTLKPEVESIKHSSKQLTETIKTFEATAVKKLEEKITSTPVQKELKRATDALSIRIRGLKEPINKVPRDRLQEDWDTVSAVLTGLIDRKTELSNVKRLGKFNADNANYCRPLLVTLVSQWDKRLILSSLSKLKGRDDKLSISRHLSSQVVLTEKELLQERYRMITVESIPRNCIRIFDFKLQRKGTDGKWIEV